MQDPAMIKLSRRRFAIRALYHFTSVPLIPCLTWRGLIIVEQPALHNPLAKSVEVGPRLARQLLDPSDHHGLSGAGLHRSPAGALIGNYQCHVVRG